MSPKNGEVYIMQDTDDEWVAPTPATAAITEALAAATELEERDLQDIDSKIDRDELQTLLEGEGEQQTFTVEGYDVMIDSSGDITVEE